MSKSISVNAPTFMAQRCASAVGRSSRLQISSSGLLALTAGGILVETALLVIPRKPVLRGLSRRTNSSMQRRKSSKNTGTAGSVVLSGPVQIQILSGFFWIRMGGRSQGKRLCGLSQNWKPLARRMTISATSELRHSYGFHGLKTRRAGRRLADPPLIGLASVFLGDFGVGAVRHDRSSQCCERENEIHDGQWFHKVSLSVSRT